MAPLGAAGELSCSSFVRNVRSYNEGKITDCSTSVEQAQTHHEETEGETGIRQCYIISRLKEQRANHQADNYINVLITSECQQIKRFQARLHIHYVQG